MRRVLNYVLAALLVLGLAVSVGACGGDDDDNGGSSKKKDDVNLTQGRDLTIAVITHGEGDTFWPWRRRARSRRARTWA